MRLQITESEGVVIGVTMLFFFGAIAAVVIVVLVRKGIAWKEVPGSRNRFTGLSLNWFGLVLVAYSLVVTADGAFLRYGVEYVQ